MSTQLVDRAAELAKKRVGTKQTFFVPEDRPGGVVGRRRRALRPALFSIPLGLATFLVACLIDIRRGQGWFGDIWGAFLRDVIGAVVIGLCSYFLQRSVEGHPLVPSGSRRRHKASGRGRLGGERKPRRSWQAPAGVPLARTWSVLVAWGWVLQLRILPGRAAWSLLYLVVAHLAFAVTVPLGSFLRAKCTPDEDAAGPRGDRAHVYLRLVACCSFAIGLGLLFVVLLKGGFTGDARVTVDLGPITVQPAEPARVLFIVSFAAVLSGVRLRSDQAWRWWDARLPFLRIPMSTVLWAAVVAVFAGGSFLMLKDLSPFLVTMVSFVLVVLLVLPVARVRIALLLLLLLWVVLPVVAGGKLDDRYEARAHPIPITEMTSDTGATYVPEQLGLAIIAEEHGLPGGVGVGQGVGAEVVPAAHNDFILAVLVEEWGVLGVVCVCALYALLLWRAFGVALRSSVGFGQTLAVALVVAFATQLLYVVAGLARLFPHGGLTVPMLSAGGSSLIVTGALFGTLVGTAATPVRDGAASPVRPGRHTGLAGRVRMVRIVGVAAVWLLGGAAMIVVPLKTVAGAQQRLAAENGDRTATVTTSSWVEELARRHSVRRPTIRTKLVDGKQTAIAVTSGDVSCGGYTSPIPFQASLGSAAGPLVRCYPDRTLYSDVLGYYTPGGGSIRGMEQIVGAVDACTPASGMWSALAGSGACGEVRDIELTIRRDTQVEARDRLTVDQLEEVGTIKVPKGAPTPIIAATIVSDPATGAIEALTSTPAYDPNARARPRAVAAAGRAPYTFKDAVFDIRPSSSEVWDAKALLGASQFYSGEPDTGLPMAAGEASATIGGHPMGDPVSRTVPFAMGSTMKLVVSVAALEAERDAYAKGDGQAIADLALVDREDSVQAPGLQGGNDDGKPCGGSLATMLAESCNTGFSLLAQAVGRDPLLVVATRLGLTGKREPRRADGLLVGESPPWFPKDQSALFGSQAIGLQGTQANVVDVAGLVNTIASSGTMMSWRVVDPEACAERRSLQLGSCNQKGTELIDPEIADAVRTGMELTVSDDEGTAHDELFQLIDDYQSVGLELAAKTGSASAATDQDQKVGWCVVIARWGPEGGKTQQRTFVTAVQGPAEFGITGATVCRSVEPLIREVVGAS